MVSDIYNHEFIDRTDFPQKRFLQVNSCGSERVIRHEYTILRSKGRSDFHFLYLQQGWLDIEVGQYTGRLKAGQCAVFYPGVRQVYTFAKAGDPVSFFIHFTGDAAVEAMESVLPSESMIYTISETTVFESLFRRLIQVHNLQLPLYIPEENSLLMQLILILAGNSIPKQPAVRRDVLHAIEYLREHVQDDVDLQQYAASIHLSYSRFNHLFSQAVGLPPHKYLLRLRLERARGLLRDTSMSIAVVAESVGIEDPFYFSRLFRKFYGMSPKEFRLQCRK